MSACTTTGSNWLPALMRSSSSAASSPMARRYGRSDIIACQASQAKTMRLASGISSPEMPSG